MIKKPTKTKVKVVRKRGTQRYLKQMRRIKDELCKTHSVY